MKFRNQAYSILAGASHFYMSGISIGWVTPTITKLQDPAQSALPHPISDWQISMMSAMTFSGIWLLCLAGPTCNRFGRKPVLVCGAVTRVVAWLALGLANSWPTLCLGKILESSVNGFVYPTTIIYISEIASVDIRGFALTITGFVSSLGILTMYAVGPFVPYRALCATAAGCSGLVGFLSCWMVESPVYFMMKGDVESADRSLKILYRSPKKRDESVTPMIKREEDLQMNNIRRLKELFLVRRNLKAFLVACVINVLQQCSGVVAILFQMTNIFKLAGSSLEPHTATIVVGLMQALSCLSSALVVERVGRRPLLLTSCFVTALANMALGVYFYLELIQSPSVHQLAWLPLASLVVFVVFYWHGLGVMPSTVTGELLGDQVKSVGSSIICTLEILSCIIVVFTYAFLNAALGCHNTFWFFSGCCAAHFVFVAVFLPETKGKSAEEIANFFT